MFAGLYLDAFRNPLVSPDGSFPQDPGRDERYIYIST